MGMQPSFIPASEDMTIIMNTMPEAPSSAVPGKKSQCTSPETSAVRTIAQKQGAAAVLLLQRRADDEDHHHVADVVGVARVPQDVQHEAREER